MLPLPPFSLATPGSIEEVLALLREHGESATLVAGGTDLLPNMKHGLLTPRWLVSLAGVASLRGISYTESSVRVGAMTTLEAIGEHPAIQAHARALGEAARSVGGPHHRRMGTLGGNLCLDTRCRYYNQSHFWREALGYCLKKDGAICHVVAGGKRCVAAASNDTAAAAIALDATVSIVGPGGSRAVRASDFYTANGLANTALSAGEVVTALVVPVVAGRISGYQKLRTRGAIDFPLLSLAARVDLDGDLVSQLEIVVSALAARPRSVGKARPLALGARLAELPTEAIAQAARAECTPLPNIEGDALWRREMVPVLVREALTRLQRSV
ncbi:MAG: FAD binding domain-containing protein [Myxococcales bacterium]|nr:FAD binding domain-containing protein [Myxococcales bacterium]MBL0196613.1 FAD binding domain-containing protein [Myxococcales bacterium]HQY60311.1 FAD binding domain-containing protein [Polyangiaceae bacterium]